MKTLLKCFHVLHLIFVKKCGNILGHDNSIAYEPWPTYDEKMLVSDTVQMGIQVNGKLKS